MSRHWAAGVCSGAFTYMSFETAGSTPHNPRRSKTSLFDRLGRSNVNWNHPCYLGGNPGPTSRLELRSPR